MTQKSILDILKLRRKELGKNQEEMGALIGVSVSNYGKKELGKVEFTVRELEVVTKALGLNFEDLDQLPHQSKPALITADEFVALSNQVLKLQKDKDELQIKLQAAQLKKRSDVFDYFAQEVEQMKDAYEDYSPRWNDIAKAAQLPEPNNFLARYGEMKANAAEEYFEERHTTSNDEEVLLKELRKIPGANIKEMTTVFKLLPEKAVELSSVLKAEEQLVKPKSHPSPDQKASKKASN